MKKKLRGIKPTTIIQDESDHVPAEILATSIKAIAEGVRRLRSGPLNKRCLMLLIQHSAPTYRGGKRIAINDIEMVFDGIDNLERAYLTKKERS